MADIVDPSGARALTEPTKSHLWGLLCRVRELQNLQERQRPVTIHWQDTEMELASACYELVQVANQDDLWKVITLLVMEASCDFGINLEDGSYDEE